ncbi:hypothetical protein KIPB_013761, partial [Kipferlia bialata]|eukprot:g13761.t1
MPVFDASHYFGWQGTQLDESGSVSEVDKCVLALIQCARLPMPDTPEAQEKRVHQLDVLRDKAETALMK